jgi:hypothetical protein
MIKITEHKKDLKMSGFISVNTSVIKNPYCSINRCDKKRVCSVCYGKYMTDRYPRLNKALIYNYDILNKDLTSTEIEIICDQLRQYNKKYIRLHSIGEISGIEMLSNYYLICENMSDTNFALWSKRKDLIQRVHHKPDNLKIVYSNPLIDKPSNKIPLMFDSIFNVISYGYAIKHKINLNCPLKCINCLKCYNTSNNVIIELLKNDQRKISRGLIPSLEAIL